MNPYLKNQNKYVLIAIAFMITAGVFFGFRFVQKIFFDPAKHLALVGQDIFFEFTDDNSGENLIIRTDKKNYAGFNGAEVYFSVTNKSWTSQDVGTIFYFDDGGKGVKDLYVLEGENWVPLKIVNCKLIENCKLKIENYNRKPVENYPATNYFNHHIKRGQTAYFKADISYPAMSKGKFFMESLGSKGAYGHLDPWYDSGYTYRKKITIDADKVIADVENFPLLATTTDADLRDTANGGKVASSTGGDIIFTDSSGALLNFELEKYASTTGEIVYWIKTDISSSTDTDLFMYYGNASASYLATTTGVWDSNYVGVWHLANDGVATTSMPDFLDSTSNDNDGSSANMIGGVQNLVSTSTIDGGVGFDGVDDYVDCGNNNNLQLSGSFSVSAWVYPYGDSLDTDALVVIRKGNTEAGTFYMQIMDSNAASGYENKLDIGYFSAASTYHETYITSTNDNEWIHVVGVFNDSGNELLSYVNGAQEKTSQANARPAQTASNLLIGKRETNVREFYGLMDEVRISNTAHSAGWIKTEYNNQVDTANFMTYGVEQTGDWYNSDWNFRKKITIDKDQVIGNESGFPVLATTTDTDLKDKTKNSGQDILFTMADGLTKIPHEIEKFNKTTGELVSWIKTDVSSTTDTTIYMYYGNPGATDQQNVTGVWDSNYKGVWHLNDAWNASSTDSTVNANNGTTNFYSATSSVAGQAGNAIDFNGVDDYVDAGSDASLEMGTHDMSICAWTYQAALSNHEGIVGKGASYAGSAGYMLDTYSTDVDIKGWISDGTTRIFPNSNTVTLTGSWMQICVAWDRDSVASFYLNGSPVGAESITSLQGDLTNSSVNLYIGTWQQNKYYFKGIIDEVRLSDTARSAQWIKTEYNNQVSVGNFLAYGGEEKKDNYPDRVPAVGWYDTAWKYRKKLAVDADMVEANLTNFPVLINYKDSRLINEARDDGYDIVFTASDGTTKLNYEREKWDNATGELVSWIKTDISSTTDTILYMYYGNSNQSSDLATTTGVWDDNFVMVQHMHHDWDATAVDSTKYNNDGTNTNFYSATSSVSTGQVDGAIDFDGVDDRIDTTNFMSSGVTAFTLEAWVYKTATKDARIIYKNNAGNTGDPVFGLASGGNDLLRCRLRISDGSGIDLSEGTISLNTWTFVVCTYDGSDVRAYKDGSEASSTPETGTLAATNDVVVIGQNEAGTSVDRHWPGIIDEVRVSNIARSAGWIKTEYNNQKSPGSFVTFYPEEENTRRTKINTSQKNFLTDGLVGYWTFDGPDVNWWTGTASDVSGQGNNGSIINMATSTAPAIGVTGQALDFDGSDDYVDATANSAGSTFTYSAWFKAEDDADNKVIMGDFAGSANAGAYMYIDSGGAYHFILGDGSGTDSNYYNGGYEDSSWHQVVGTFNDTGNIISYVDGVLVDSVVVVNTYGTGSSVGNFRYIGYSGASTQYFNGTIDEVRVYDRALSADEIGELYQAGARRLKVNAPQVNKLTDGLVGNWTFNGQDVDWGSNTAYDRSGEGNNGVITNMSTSTSPTEGISGQALEFDGVDDYVDAGDIDVNQITISAWINADTVALNRRIVSKWTGAYLLSTDDNDSNKFTFAIKDTGTNVDICDSNTSGTYSTGVWTHVTGTYDGTTCKIYVDGVDRTVVSLDNAVGNIANTAPTVKIGREAIDASNWFNGLIDDVRIYNRALSAAEILDLYNVGSRRFQPN